MTITAQALLDQVNAFYRAGYGPTITATEQRFGLPLRTLYAIGSRETNLSLTYVDGTVLHADGHGHGVFGLDDRSHTIPQPFTFDLQCSAAAQVLVAERAWFTKLGWSGDDALRVALSAYNCGRRNAELGLIHPAHDSDRRTTNGDYGRDVLERLVILQNR